MAVDRTKRDVRALARVERGRDRLERLRLRGGARRRASSSATRAASPRRRSGRVDGRRGAAAALRSYSTPWKTRSETGASASARRRPRSSARAACRRPRRPPSRRPRRRRRLGAGSAPPSAPPRVGGRRAVGRRAGAAARLAVAAAHRVGRAVDDRVDLGGRRHAAVAGEDGVRAEREHVEQLGAVEPVELRGRGRRAAADELVAEELLLRAHDDALLDRALGDEPVHAHGARLADAVRAAHRRGRSAGSSPVVQHDRRPLVDAEPAAPT